MPPWYASLGAGMRERQRKERVSCERVCLVLFAGIYIRLSCVASGIDKKGGALIPQEFPQHIKTCVVHLRPRTG